jgi:hypothetical protein
MRTARGAGGGRLSVGGRLDFIVGISIVLAFMNEFGLYE